MSSSYLACVLACAGVWAAAGDARADARKYRPSASERIARAADRGELALKEAVMLQARLRFAPERVAADTKFAPRDGEVAVFDPCGTAFYKDVHRVYEELSDKERAELRGYSPDLQVIMDARAAKSPPGVTALPNFGLSNELAGADCIVHYNLTGTHAAPDKTYVELVRKYMDMAIKSKMVKNFRKAYAEGYSNGVGKLHVYIVSMAAEGEWVDVSSVSGDKMTGYIKISPHIKANYDAKVWQVVLKGVCYHEYFHGIQSAYNAWSTLWFLEGTAVWAQHYYAKDWTFFKPVFDAAASVVQTPNETLYVNTFRKYSTSALAYYLSDKYKGYQFMQTYFSNSEAKRNAMELLKDTIAEQGSTFDAELKGFWAHLALKRIKSLAKYLPDVALAGTINAYGVKDVAGNVKLTGAAIYKCEPQAGAKGATLITLLAPGAVGAPQGILVPGTKPTVVEFDGGRAWVANFGKKVSSVLLIVTDTSYTADDATVRPFKYSAIVPFIQINGIESVSPVFSGESSRIDIKYDLLGTYPGEPFSTQFQVKEKGPDVSDYVSGIQNLNPGEGQTHTLYFNTSWTSEGSYKFGFEYRVPQDSWGMPQVKSTGSTSVTVKKPPETARMAHATTGATLAHTCER